MQLPLRLRLRRRLLAATVLMGAAAAATPAAARCVVNGNVTTCDATPPNPETGGATNSEVRVLTGAIVLPRINILQDGVLTSETGSIVRSNDPTAAEIVVNLAPRARGSVSGSIISTQAGDQGVVLSQGSSLVVNQGGLLEVAGGRLFVFTTRPTAAGIGTDGGDNISIEVNGTVRSLGGEAPAIAGYNVPAPAGTRRYSQMVVDVGATGLVESLGDFSPAIRAANASVINVSGTVRATGASSSAIQADGALTVNVRQGGVVEASQAPAIAQGVGVIDLTVAGTVNGPAANQIAIDLGDLDDRLTVTTTGRINGIAAGGAGTDLFTLLAATGTSGTYDFQSQPLTGFELFAKDGAGTFTLVGDGRTVAAGPFAVNAGTLVVNANMTGSAFTVASGARLGGTGTLGSATVSGTLAPGNGIGTITATGPIGFAAGSTFEVEVNAAGASDRITTSGAATLSGGTVQVLAQNGSYAPSTQYVIISAAGGVAGTFAGVTSNMAFLTPSLSYPGGEVRLFLTRNDLDFADAAATPNQSATGEAIEALGAANPVFIALIGQSAGGARAAFDALSGEIYPSLAGYLTAASRLPRNALLNAGRNAEEGLTLWADAGGNWLEQEGDGLNGTAAGEGDSTGVQGGLTFRSGGFVGSLSVGGYDQSYDVAARFSSASANSLFVGGDVGFHSARFGVRAGYGRTFHDISIRREILFGGFGVQGNSTEGETDQFFADAYYDLLTGPVRAVLFAGYAHVNTDLDPLTENQSAASLSVDVSEIETDIFRIGARLRGEFGGGSEGVSVSPHASLAYVHTSGDRFAIAANRFAGATSPFLVAGAPLPEDAAELRLGGDLLFGRFRVGVSYDGLIGSEWQEHGARLTAAMSF